MGISKYDRTVIPEWYVRHDLGCRGKPYQENIIMAIVHLVSKSSKNPTQPITVLYNLDPQEVEEARREAVNIRRHYARGNRQRFVYV